jgi:hypothetical protein
VADVLAFAAKHKHPLQSPKRLCALWTCAAPACLDNVTRRRLLQRLREIVWYSMKKLALIYALLLSASPAAAQLATSSRVQQLNGQSVQTTPIEAPTTGVFCIEEMTATFCNVTAGPNTSGYGSRSVSTSSSRAASSGVSASSGGAGAISPSIPPCSSEPPFNELCN